MPGVILEGAPPLPASVPSTTAMAVEQQAQALDTGAPLPIPLDLAAATACTLTHLTPASYTAMPWKNGCGSTEQIYVDPPGVDFRKEKFNWRLSSALVADSCTFSVFAECFNTLVLLPAIRAGVKQASAGDLNVSNEAAISSLQHLQTATTGRRMGSKQLALKLRHREETKPRLVKPLAPYTYDSSIETSCEVASPCQDITLIVDRRNAKADVTVESIDADSPPFRKLLLAHTTAIYVVAGSCSDARLAVSVEGQSGGTVTLAVGDTLLIKKHDLVSPRYVKAVSVSQDGDAASRQIDFIFMQISQVATTVETAVSAVAAKLFAQGLVDTVPPVLALDASAGRLTMDGGVYMEARHEYHPPQWAFVNSEMESSVPPPIICDQLNLDDFPLGKKSTAWINMMKQGLSDWIRVPCIVARGAAPASSRGDSPVTASATDRTSASTTTDNDAPPEDIVVGITAALHGNEVNGVSCIQRLMAELDIATLRGTVIALPCLNVPGYLGFKREFSDGKDLNRQFPGHPDGVASQVYAHLIMEKIINNFNYLIDLHTASFGRVNSYYVRADMNDTATASLANLQQPQIILHNSGQDGTMRSAASQRGIKSITVEIGNPQQFQNQFIQWSYQGLRNILNNLGMYTSTDAHMRDRFRITDRMGSQAVLSFHQPHPAVICSKGFWTYTKTGGVLEVYPSVNSIVKKGVVVARIKNIFGNVIDEYFAPCDAIVIGRSSNPVSMAGDRILHFGVLHKEGESLPAVAKENY